MQASIYVVIYCSSSSENRLEAVFVIRIDYMSITVERDPSLKYIRNLKISKIQNIPKNVRKTSSLKFMMMDTT